MNTFKIGDRVKPDALGAIKDTEACGLPIDGLFEELDAARGTIILLESNPRYVKVKWDDGMVNSQEASYLIKV